MKIDWLNGALRFVAENEGERRALAAVLRGIQQANAEEASVVYIEAEEPEGVISGTRP
jgi:hypothetical protein